MSERSGAGEKSFHRKYQLSIEIEADTWRDAVADLLHILQECDQRKDGYESVMGGYSGNHIVTTKIDPDITPEYYQKLLENWMEHRKQDSKP